MREELAFLELVIVLHLQRHIELPTSLVQIFLLLRLMAAVRAVVRPLGRTGPHSLSPLSLLRTAVSALCGASFWDWIEWERRVRDGKWVGLEIFWIGLNL